jgi:hypothetical protein
MTKTFWEAAFDNAPNDAVRKALLAYEQYDVLMGLDAGKPTCPRAWESLANIWQSSPLAFAPQAELAARRVAQALQPQPLPLFTLTEIMEAQKKGYTLAA